MLLTGRDLLGAATLALTDMGIPIVAVTRGEKGALRGACVGALYMALGIALVIFLSGQSLSASAYAADLGMGIAAGGLFGMILSNLRAK